VSERTIKMTLGWVWYFTLPQVQPIAQICGFCLCRMLAKLFISL